jgi:hypothetical protein
MQRVSFSTGLIIEHISVNLRPSRCGRERLLHPHHRIRTALLLILYSSSRSCSRQMHVTKGPPSTLERRQTADDILRILAGTPLQDKDKVSTS